MIKAVFFDWFNTLACYDPPREQLHSQAFREFGIHLSPKKIVPGIMLADREYFRENTRLPIRERSPEEQAKVWIGYEEIILTEAGIAVSVEPDTLLKIMDRVRQLSADLTFVLFDDVLITLKGLKEQDFTLGLLSNFDRDMRPICRGLGMEPYLDFIVTSGEVGADKPQPPVFLTALEKAGVTAAEAIHVGDQYQLDVIGAGGWVLPPGLLTVTTYTLRSMTTLEFIA